MPTKGGKTRNKKMETITVNLNVAKLDKTRLVKGEKGTYANLVLIPTPNGQFGDYMVKESLTKDERTSGKQTPILGNAKISKGKKAVSEDGTNW